jgi:hypothetical protein
VYALAGVLLAGCWQAATVHFNYGGNWTALFCAGDRFPVAPELAAGTYTFKASYGYDGQFYRYVAHDPWFQKGWSKYCDQPRLRCSRIAVPALAWILAGGQARYIDAGYVAAVLLWIGLGIYWLARYVASQGRSPAWGLGFLLVPGTLISIDRLTIDIALIALTAAWVWYIRTDSPVRLYIVLALAGLTRETGLALAGACCLHALWDRRWRKAALYATAGLPALGWYAVVATHAALVGAQAAVVHTPHAHHSHWYGLPLTGIVERLFRPERYPLSASLMHAIQALDVVALCGLLLAAGLAAWSLRKGRLDQREWAAAVFLTLMLGASGGVGFWRNVYGYGRPLSPLLLLVGLRAATGSPWLLAPLILMDLRIAAQCAPQLWGILRGLL